MASFSRSSYSFSNNNTNYINAIATYNKKVHIQKINGKDVSEKGYRGADLPKVVPTIRADEINIETVSGDSVSTIGTIPAVEKDRLLSAMPAALTEKDRAAAEENAAQISGYIKSITARGGFDVYIGTPDDLAPLNQSSAIYLLDSLQKKHEITGAMLLPQHDAILLQFNGDNYLLQYGKNTTLKEMTRMIFDIDDGFILKTMCYGDKIPPVDQAIHGELQAHFKRWKNNNYTGELIPASRSGFEYKNNNAKVAAASVAAPAVVQIEQPAPAAVQPAPTSHNDGSEAQRKRMREEFDAQEQLLAQLASINDLHYGNLGLFSGGNNPAPAAANVGTSATLAPQKRS